MAIILPSNLTLNAGSVPAWGVVVQNAINSGLTPAWDLGTQSRTITLACSLFGINVFPSWAGVMLDQALGEYRAAGWNTSTSVSGVGISGLPTAFHITFDRW